MDSQIPDSSDGIFKWKAAGIAKGKDANAGRARYRKGGSVLFGIEVEEKVRNGSRRN